MSRLFESMPGSSNTKQFYLIFKGPPQIQSNMQMQISSLTLFPLYPLAGKLARVSKLSLTQSLMQLTWPKTWGGWA